MFKHWGGFGFDLIWYDRCKGDYYFYKTSVKGIKTVWSGFAIRVGFYRFQYKKQVLFKHEE